MSDVTETLDAAELLDRAADIVDRGWCRGHYYFDGDVCATGAMGLAYAPQEICRVTDSEPTGMISRVDVSTCMRKAAALREQA